MIKPLIQLATSVFHAIHSTWQSIPPNTRNEFIVDAVRFAAEKHLENKRERNKDSNISGKKR